MKTRFEFYRLMNGDIECEDCRWERTRDPRSESDFDRFLDKVLEPGYRTCDGCLAEDSPDNI